MLTMSRTPDCPHRFEVCMGSQRFLPSGLLMLRCQLTCDCHCSAAIGSENEDGSKKFVIRPYTPTSPKDAKGYFDLVVKVYEQGKMSKHFGELKVNACWHTPLYYLNPACRCFFLGRESIRCISQLLDLLIVLSWHVLSILEVCCYASRSFTESLVAHSQRAAEQYVVQGTGCHSKSLHGIRHVRHKAQSGAHCRKGMRWR